MQGLGNLWTQDHRKLAVLFAIKFIGKKHVKNGGFSAVLTAFIHSHLTIFVGLPILKVLTQTILVTASYRYKSKAFR